MFWREHSICYVASTISVLLLSSDSHSKWRNRGGVLLQVFTAARSSCVMAASFSVEGRTFSDEKVVDHQFQISRIFDNYIPPTTVFP